MKKDNKQDDLSVFRDLCLSWLRKLGLYDWDARVIVSDQDGANGHVYLSNITRKACICLCEEREEIVSLESIAKHEALEILLADVSFLLERYYSKDFVENELHKIINRLMVAM